MSRMSDLDAELRAAGIDPEVVDLETESPIRRHAMIVPFLKRLWRKIHYFFDNLIYGPPKLPDAVKEALAHKKQGWHLLTEKEYYQLVTGTLPLGTLISKGESTLDHLEPGYIRFESLYMAERMDKLTDAERIELDLMSTPPIMAPWRGREMFGMRRTVLPK